AGHTEVVADGRFDRSTADAVRRFQKVNGTEEVNGMIGGESWPLLVAPLSPVSGRESTRAWQALGASGHAPSDADTAAWQRLLHQEALRHGR
ncbi:MAG TPA: peptidoglycan-binding domain-containing protein, partial [Pseudonocardia sp.]|nr:peptidoglycan-binding domain-containing protein [Pseudonocardia sp.]